MKPLRKVAVLSAALALVGTGCSQFAPKAGVGVKQVSVKLAFGIDVEKLLTTPPPPSTPPVELPTVEPTPTRSIIIVEPPKPVCPVNATHSTRDGAPPSTIKEQKFDERADGEGAEPRLGKYYTFYQYNFSGEGIVQGYNYKTLSGVGGEVRQVNDQLGGGFGYDVREPEFGHQIDTAWVVTPTPEDSGNPNQADTSGIYLQELKIPRKPDEQTTEVSKRPFTVTDPGVRLVRFPIETGDESTDVQAFPADPDTSGETPAIGGFGNTITVRSTVGSPEKIFVCDQLAEAFRVGVTIEISGDTEVRIVGNFWIAPQYGGWPIQESFVIDGGAEFISGNFFSRIARLDPGDVV